MGIVNVTAFQPNPLNCVAIAVTSTSGNTKIHQTNGLLNMSCLVYNAGPNDCFVETGVSGVTAILPTTGGTLGSMPIPAGVAMTVRLTDQYLGAICAAGNTATLYVHPGEGV